MYLNVPAGENPEAHPELRIGRMPLFGLAEASRADTAHAGNGLKYAYRIGNVVRRLQSENRWNADDVRISFVPRRPAAALDGCGEQRRRNRSRWGASASTSHDVTRHRTLRD